MDASESVEDTVRSVQPPVPDNGFLFRLDDYVRTMKHECDVLYLEPERARAIMVEYVRRSRNEADMGCMARQGVVLAPGARVQYSAMGGNSQEKVFRRVRRVVQDTLVCYAAIWSKDGVIGLDGVPVPIEKREVLVWTDEKEADPTNWDQLEQRVLSLRTASVAVVDHSAATPGKVGSVSYWYKRHDRLQRQQENE